MEPSAKIITDSVTEKGHRLTSFEIVIHRYVLAELNTHRVFSRSSASSRAIPVSKQIVRIQEHPAIPVVFPSEQSGMQGGEALSAHNTEEARATWLEAAEDAVLFAEHMIHLGVHKSVTNRLLEPFMWHTVIVTAGSFENFFGLRCNPLAQPELRVTAELMMAEYEASEPVLLEDGDWHLPYVSPDELEDGLISDVQLRQISAARCARVSYLTHDGKRDWAKDIELYERLASAEPMHSAPLEHVAKPAPENCHKVNIIRGEKPLELTLPKYGNVIGWHSLRYDVEATKQYQAFR